MLSPDALAVRARHLKLLLFDVDGVLTDGTLIVHADGSDSKRFYIRDGSALVWAQRDGLRVGLLSGRPSEATVRRATELGIKIVVQGEQDKAAAYRQILAGQGLQDAEVGFMGDDLLDLPVLSRVGLSAAPADAASDVLARVDWISQYDGGRGAVREFVEVILRARGSWNSLIDSFLG